jgi:hypothetical protein
MKALVYKGPRDVRVEKVPDSAIVWSACRSTSAGVIAKLANAATRVRV